VVQFSGLRHGHKTRSIFDRYDVVDKKVLRESARKLEQAETPATPNISTRIGHVTQVGEA
jgi:hypothetical protein